MLDSNLDFFSPDSFTFPLIYLLLPHCHRRWCRKFSLISRTVIVFNLIEFSFVKFKFRIRTSQIICWQFTDSIHYFVIINGFIPLKSQFLSEQRVDLFFLSLFFKLKLCYALSHTTFFAHCDNKTIKNETFENYSPFLLLINKTMCRCSLSLDLMIFILSTKRVEDEKRN